MFIRIYIYGKIIFNEGLLINGGVMKKNKMGFIKKVKISLFDIRGYNDLLRLSLSHAIAYSLALSIIVGSIVATISLKYINKVESSIRDIVSSEGYEFEMSNGILDFKDSPIKKDYGSFLVLIDTNISLDQVDTVRNILVHKDSSLAILKDGVYVNIDGEKLEYKYFENLYKIDNATFLKALDFVGIVKYIIVLTTILVTFLGLLINSLILSLLGVFLNKSMNKNMSYSNILKLSIYSMTLATLIKIIYPLGAFSMVISATYFLIFINKFESIEL